MRMFYRFVAMYGQLGLLLGLLTGIAFYFDR